MVFGTGHLWSSDPISTTHNVTAPFDPTKPNHNLFALDLAGWPGFTYDFLRLGFIYLLIRYQASMAYIHTAYKSAVQRLSALPHRGSNYLASECIRRLSNVSKGLAESLPTIYQVRLVFDTNAHREASLILHIQSFLVVLGVLCLWGPFRLKLVGWNFSLSAVCIV